MTTDTSVITCIANDFGYDKIFERQLEGLGQKGDLLIVFSTSGKKQKILLIFLKNQGNEYKINCIAWKNWWSIKENFKL